MIVLSLQIIAFDELKTDYKNPIDQCNTLNPVSDTTIEQLPGLFDCMQICSTILRVFFLYTEAKVFLLSWFHSFLSCTVLLNKPACFEFSDLVSCGNLTPFCFVVVVVILFFLFPICFSFAIFVNGKKTVEKVKKIKRVKIAIKVCTNL